MRQRNSGQRYRAARLVSLTTATTPTVEKQGTDGTPSDAVTPYASTANAATSEGQVRSYLDPG